jgi:glycosyltransferase involved in cell wall biosynthesis
VKPIRAAVVIPRYSPLFGGAENQCRLLSRTLIESWQVSIPFLITRRIRADLPRSELMEGIHVRRFGFPGINRWSEYWFYVLLTFYLVWHAEEYDIIHCHATSIIGFAVVISGKITKKPVILKLSSNGELEKGFGNAKWRQSPLGGFIAWLRQEVGRFTVHSAYTVALNQEAKSELEVLGAKNISMIPNGVDPKIFLVPKYRDKCLLKRTLGFSEDDIVVLFTGRFVEDKGIDLLLNAFTGLIQKHEGKRPCKWKLCLVGSDILQEGSNRSSIVAVSERHSNTIHILPPKIPVVEYLHMSDIFVFPSRREGMPNSVLEAFAVGLPCVLSDIAPHLELAAANPGACVLFFASDDVSSLQIALNDALLKASHGVSESLGVRSLLNPKFEIHNVTRAYLNLYRNILNLSLSKEESIFQSTSS